MLFSFLTIFTSKNAIIDIPNNLPNDDSFPVFGVLSFLSGCFVLWLALLSVTISLLFDVSFSSVDIFSVNTTISVFSLTSFSV